MRRAPVHLRCADGYELSQVIIRDTDLQAFLVETPAGPELISRHAVTSIVLADEELLPRQR